MYFSKSKFLKKKFYHCLIVSFCFFVSFISFSQNSYAQRVHEGDVDCTITSPSPDILFPDVGLVPNKVTSRSGIFIECETNYFSQEAGRNGWTAIGSMCLSIQSLDGKVADNRYLYLNGNASSPSALEFNYYSSFSGTNRPIGDGINSLGFNISSLTAASFTGSAPNFTPVRLLFANAQGESIGIYIEGRYDFTTPVPVGTYSNVFNFFVYSNGGYSPPVSPPALCSQWPKLAATLQLDVQANVLPSCRFSVKKNINFGVYTSINSSIASTGELSVQCNLNADYTIQLDGGRAPDGSRNSNTSDRRMTLLTDAGTYDGRQQIGYFLYLPNTQTIWGNGANDSYKANATAVEQVIRIDARINPTVNRTPIPGIYRDEVSATIIY